MTLILDDGPGRAVVIFDAGSTLGAFIRVDDVALLAFGDSTNRTLVEAAAALDAVFRDFIGHDGLLQTCWKKPLVLSLFILYDIRECLKLRLFIDVILAKARQPLHEILPPIASGSE
jgi:hypothetical protein